MTDSDQPLSPDRLTALVAAGDHEQATAVLDRLDAVAVDQRKRVLRSLRTLAEDEPDTVDGFAEPLVAFLTDDDRAVRLTTAKLFVTLAQSNPGSVLPVIESLASRLADEEEFYYVRARSAETLGYVALEYPDEVGTPDILADLRIGLAFDEPEVREKLAKALAHVAIGNPGRLRHHVSALTDLLDDDNELVRYYLATTLAVVGCEQPATLDDAGEELTARIEDATENPYVRGRALEALGVLARFDSEMAPITAEKLPDEVDEPFVSERLTVARQALTDAPSDETLSARIGTVDAVRKTTDEIAAEITSPDEDQQCPHCGLGLSAQGPPRCPRCGAPY